MYSLTEITEVNEVSWQYISLKDSSLIQKGENYLSLGMSSYEVIDDSLY